MNSEDLPNPEDLQRRINRGSERVMQELEKLSANEMIDESVLESIRNYRDKFRGEDV